MILTRGDRPAELAAAVDSVLAQDGDPVEVVVVGNGADVPGLPSVVRVVRLPDNVGIAAGRNEGARASTGEVIVFLDDDGRLADRDAVALLRLAFAADERLGIVSFRVRDPAGGPGARRHVPRLRAGDPHRSSDVTTFLGGACAVRRTVLDRCGGFPDAFFYAHEETDLAWRALDAGYRIRYDASIEMLHPATAPTRHAVFYRFNARNRVWLARRLLPWPLAVVYLLDWVALTVVRVREPAALRAWFTGFAEGWRTPCGPRRPITWRTALRMTRLGRPPII
ncbi:MAG: glycosyltransferase family 2 protein [Frankiaceae bacterium]